MTTTGDGHRQSLELKVRCSGADLDRVRASLAEGDGPTPVTARQVDSYFSAPVGRLKPRVTGPVQRAVAGQRPGSTSREGAGLIAYRRPNAASGRWSEYEVVPVSSGQVESPRAVLAHTPASSGGSRR